MKELLGRLVGIASKAGIIVLFLAAIGLLLLIFREEGLAGVWSTIKVDTAKVLGKFVFVMIVFFVITGAINHLQKRHPNEFQKAINGDYGMVFMLWAAALTPGPSGGQQLQDAWNTPGVKKANVLLCLTAMMAASITMFLFRAKFIGPTLTLIWTGIAVGLLLEVWAIGRVYETFLK